MQNDGKIFYQSNVLVNLVHIKIFVEYFGSINPWSFGRENTARRVDNLIFQDLVKVFYVDVMRIRLNCTSARPFICQLMERDLKKM